MADRKNVRTKEPPKNHPSTHEQQNTTTTTTTTTNTTATGHDAKNHGHAGTRGRVDDDSRYGQSLLPQNTKK
ncbi:hypothetical protein RvY_00265 [Ramazzottius varieornatus]|uniref:Uncharacterized protein n=1 Tax=Ramazzottius varieornatus TaxID=947166 RepID=A0A1D1UC82_RAMVA|nr:hypothetical protein RvY_00265 [Ramazzottius varieornatus]